jgi:small-conductance mechanosensitive channel
MPESNTTPLACTPPAPDAPATRGYFNQAQLEDLDLADSVLTASHSHPAEMTDHDITPAWLVKFQSALTEARQRASATGQQVGEAIQATADTTDAAARLVTALKQIQSAAKQKHQMDAEDGDITTNFTTDGYLIGSRLDASRAILRQCADSLIARAQADSLPGFKTPEKIAAVKSLLKAYASTKDHQQDTTEDKELSRIDRDTLLHSINRRRTAIQHAADALWPASAEASRPIRKTFGLPLNRAMGL